MAGVLIIDDEPDSCDAAAACLTKAGHTVRRAAGGDEAIDAVTAEVPDAILLDMRMAGMDGIAVLDVLRSYLRWAAVPVAILTAYPDDPRLWHVGERGVSRVFAKSNLNVDDMLTWMDECTARKPPIPEPPLST